MTYDFSHCYDRSVDGARKWSGLDSCDINYEEMLIPMTIADLEFCTPPEIKRGLIDYLDNRVLGYTNPTKDYLKTVKSYIYQNYEFEIETDWITTTPGVVSALSTAVRALTEEGDGVIIFSPVYGPFYDVINGQNRELLESTLELKDSRYYIDFAELEALAASAKAKMILLCSPHNPGSRNWTLAELEQIARIADKYNLIVVSDEIHSDLTFEKNQHYIYASINDKARMHSIICTSASKAYNIAGLQCSNIIIPNPDYKAKFDQVNLASGIQAANALGLKATELAYTECNNWRKAMLEVVEENIAFAKRYLEDLDSRFKVMEPDSSFLLWVDISEFALTNEEFVSLLRKEAGVYVSDGTIFGDKGNGWIRMNVGMPQAELKNTLKRLNSVSLFKV